MRTDHGRAEEAAMLVKETSTTERNDLCFLGTTGNLTVMVKLRLKTQLWVRPLKRNLQDSLGQ